MANVSATAPLAKASAGRTQRLKRRPQFLHVAKGAKAAMPGFILQARRRSAAEGATADAASANCRIGFTATKKIGNAVMRNRTKRRLRAAADALLPLYGRPDYDYVLVGRTATSMCKFDVLCRDLQIAIARVHQQRSTINQGQKTENK